MLPNCWGFCSSHLDPNNISSSDQHIHFTLHYNGGDFGMIVVYTSTNYMSRRHLWCHVTAEQSHYNLSWTFIGNFNTILGAHGRKDQAHTEKRLDIVVYNHRWLGSWNASFRLTLIKASSDHYPILLDFQLTKARHSSSFKLMMMWA